MTFGDPRRGATARPVLERRRRGPLAPTLVVLGVLVVLVVLFAQIWTEVLWFQQLGYLVVYRTQVLAQIALFLLGGGLMAAAVAGSLLFAYRSRPVYAPVPGDSSIERYRESLEPLRRLVVIALPAALGLFAGSAAAQQWDTVLLWWNRVGFGATDPQFGRDVGFFVFTLPFLELLVGFATAVVVLSGLSALAVHYLYGGLRLQGQGPRTSRGARVQLAALGAAFVLLQGASYWLDRYGLLTMANSRITGGQYTDINAVLPARTILAVVTVVVALAFLSVVFTGDWRIPAAGAALMLVTAVIAGGLLPQLVQRFQVRPNEAALEAEYIQRGIQATRAAYDIDDVEVIPYRAATEAQPQQLRDDAATIPGIRLLDPEVVSDTYRQLQQQRQYYAFPDSLDVGRYEIDGQTRDTVIAVREVDLDGVPDAQRNWTNDHTVYTHGFGVVAAYGNERDDDGTPVFFQSGIPSSGELGGEDAFQQRIYFGERSPSYSIVGAPEGSTPVELDFPDDESGTGEVRTTYEGEGGVPVGSLFRELLYAIKFQDQNILLSDRVNSQSRIMYDRSPRERVEKVAPFLELDGDPYPAVVGGRVVWVVDGYTTTARYPYSQLEELEDATRDSITQSATSVVALQQQVNYIRNSVKAVVDSYDGSVTLYAWDQEDPLLQAWQRVFPGIVEPLAEVPAELMSHLRYPQDLFKVQRTLLERYRVQDPEAFFGGGDFWQVPADPTSGAQQAPTQPPYYLSIQMPGTEEPSFSLTSTYIPRGQNARNVLTGFVAVDADAGDQAGEVREDYGRIRILELPRDLVISGPGQVQNDFNADTEVQEELFPVRQTASEVINGNLLTLPVGGGLLYVQPVYVRGSGETSYPLLRKVLVAFGEDVAIADTLDAALDAVFGGDSGATAGDAGQEGTVTDPPADGAEGGGDGGTTAPDPTATPSPTDGATAEPAPPAPAGDANARLQQALVDAQTAIQRSQEALAAGDFAAYGQAQDQLQDAVSRAVQAQEELGQSTSTTP